MTLARTSPLPMVAALYVHMGGVYYGRDDIEPWGWPNRDAREYAGPWPVIAHPPCERWGRYWGGGPMLARSPKQKTKGDDKGCFAAALKAVRTWGGVLEHPEASHAWAAHGLTAPSFRGGWVKADNIGGWTCCVEQGWYGHKSRKRTWLYAAGVSELPEFKWGAANVGHPFARLDDGFHSKEERRRAQRCGTVARLTRYERKRTPPEFRDVLLSIARIAKPAECACPKECDCQDEPRGLVSNECPEHNDGDERVSPDCPLHGNPFCALQPRAIDCPIARTSQVPGGEG